jgi:hypothetical protein
MMVKYHYCAVLFYTWLACSGADVARWASDRVHSHAQSFRRWAGLPVSQGGE